MKKRRLWSAHQFKAYSREIKETLDRLVPEYQEAVDYTHSKRDAGTDENKGQVRNSGVSDPTGEIVASQEWNRGTLLQACRKLEQAAKDVDAAQALVKRVFSSRDDYFEPLSSYRP